MILQYLLSTSWRLTHARISSRGSPRRAPASSWLRLQSLCQTNLHMTTINNNNNDSSTHLGYSTYSLLSPKSSVVISRAPSPSDWNHTSNRRFRSFPAPRRPALENYTAHFQIRQLFPRHHVNNSQRRPTEGCRAGASNLSSAAERQHCACAGWCWRWLTGHDLDVRLFNDANVLVLTVNLKLPSHHHLYKSAGRIETSTLYNS